MIGTFEVILNYLQRRNINCTLQELSTGNLYRARTLLTSLQVQPNEPGFNPNLRFAECEYRDDVAQATQGFIGWLAPGNPGTRKWLYRVATTQVWNPSGGPAAGDPYPGGPWWNPDLVNTLRQ